MAAALKNKLAAVRSGRVNTKVAVVAHPEWDSYSIKLMSVPQRSDLSEVSHALDEVRPPKDGKVVVFTTSAPMALLYANYIATRFGAEVVECAGHSSDTCTCVDDYLGAIDCAIIIDSNDQAPIMAGMLGNKVQRECEYPLKFGAARLFVI